MKEIAKINEFGNLAEFQKYLNDAPAVSQIRTNSMANNSKYLPINYIEKLLDEHYSGLWQSKNFVCQVIANEIIGTIELSVFHPVAKEWITRIGAGSVMIQTAKNQPPTVENKIKNTLVKDFPHLKAECIKNAAKSLGVVFGRNLNRDDDNSEFEYLPEKIEAKNERTELLIEAFQVIENDNTIQNKENAKNKIVKLPNDKIINYIKNANTKI